MEFVPLIIREISLGPSTIETEKCMAARSNELTEINVIYLVSLIGFRVIKDRMI